MKPGTVITSYSIHYTKLYEIALWQACSLLAGNGVIPENPVREPVAAVSVGMLGGKVLVDLDYAEDSRAQVDLNVVMTGRNNFV